MRGNRYKIGEGNGGFLTKKAEKRTLKVDLKCREEKRERERGCVELFVVSNKFSPG